jgi:hypothetical protein
MLSSLAIAALLLFQYYPTPGVPDVPLTANPGSGDPNAIATFHGTFKSADKKYLMIDVEDGNTMRMFVKGAKFILDGKPAKAAQFHTGDKVTVDAARDTLMNLVAVRVTAAPAKKAPERQPDKTAAPR